MRLFKGYFEGGKTFYKPLFVKKSLKFVHIRLNFQVILAISGRGNMQQRKYSQPVSKFVLSLCLIQCPEYTMSSLGKSRAQESDYGVHMCLKGEDISMEA